MSNIYNSSLPVSPALEFRNVSVAFDDEPALIDISFQLYKGELIFVTGESGSGKSVLLRLAMGLLKPDSGQILSATAKSNCLMSRSY
jgi:phospholipid/cholesterol/gamma-HCH transport system ATP-binding protein